ncbi:MAG TPA: metallophosphoesterase family protein [Terriglobales bacterium]|nr:metallophosphoesterase family protein [Terriglobales bacterium]
MRMAAIYDIHGNVPALEAVLKEIQQCKVDQIVVGGDVLPGPMPRETLACLLGLGTLVEFIYGNGEIAVLEQMAGRDPVTVPEQYRGLVRWNAQQLDEEHERVLASWPKTVRARIDGLGEVLFCHATPRDENECFTRLTPEDRLLPIFRGLDAPLVICGHTHMQFDRTIGHIRVVNAGSVGMPFGEPGAYWLLLGPKVELRRTAYDLAHAAYRIRATKYPQAEPFAAQNVLSPPTEAQMLEFLARAELK